MKEIEALEHRLETKQIENITILTGAGISAESGVPTFRGAGGLWENHRPEELATPGAFARDPVLVWRWYAWRQGLVGNAAPNDAHRALVDLEQLAGETIGFTLVTQNVDGLHFKAGSRKMIELHGNLWRTRCTREGLINTMDTPVKDIPPMCSCGAMLRPDVVWFGESIDLIEPAMHAAAQADLLVVIGTSGVVYPAAGLVGMVRNGVTVEINPEETPLSHQVDFSIRSTASHATPELIKALSRSLR